MFLECSETNDYWALTVGDLYHVKEDGDESRIYIIDDNGTELDVEHEWWYTWTLLADPTVLFEEETD